MEKMMGHADTPVRRIFNYASDHFHEKTCRSYRFKQLSASIKPMQNQNPGCISGVDFEVFDKSGQTGLAGQLRKCWDKPLKKVFFSSTPRV
jgi:hypothetical protein